MGRRGQGGRGGGFLKRKGERSGVRCGGAWPEQNSTACSRRPRAVTAAACPQPLRVVGKSRRKPTEEEGKEEKGGVLRVEDWGWLGLD